MLAPDHLNNCVGVCLLVLAGVMVVLLLRLLSLQRRQLRALEDWLVEQRAANQLQQASEQRHAAETQAASGPDPVREQQIAASRQGMADAVAALHQLKRQFG